MLKLSLSNSERMCTMFRRHWMSLLVYAFKNFEEEPATVTGHSWSQDDHKYDLKSNNLWIFMQMLRLVRQRQASPLFELKLQWLKPACQLYCIPTFHSD